MSGWAFEKLYISFINNFRDEHAQNIHKVLEMFATNRKTILALRKPAPDTILFSLSPIYKDSNDKKVSNLMLLPYAIG